MKFKTVFVLTLLCVVLIGTSTIWNPIRIVDAVSHDCDRDSSGHCIEDDGDIEESIGDEVDGADSVKDFKESEFFPSEAGISDGGDEEEIEPVESIKSDEPKVEVKTIPYKKPSSSGLLYLETFDDDVFSKWFKSSSPKFLGEWTTALRQSEAIAGDLGLRVMDAAKHHAIATKMSGEGLKNNKGKAVVVSYEVKHEEPLECGGSYLKLFNSNTLSGDKAINKFDNETPYVIMFGPDRCGVTKKVHVIIKQFNPVSKTWIEHHLNSPPTPPEPSLTHVYSLELLPDNTYSVYIDGAVVKTGSMHTDFTPPFSPLTTIEDPNDKKPEDWIDATKIPDTTAVKPDDWDESAPRMIPDVNAKKPENWLENEEKLIPNPDAVKPSIWNDEDDGEWTRPLIPNPVCGTAEGCGPWTPPMTANPAYRGKWQPPMIDNPAYKGQWVPKRIPNPDYFISENPHAIADIDSIGFELWTMQGGILFDNIAIARSFNAIQTLIDETWKLRSDIEMAKNKKEEKTDSNKIISSELWKNYYNTAETFFFTYPVPCGIVVIIFFALIAGTLRRRNHFIAAATAELEKHDNSTQDKPIAKEKSKMPTSIQDQNTGEEEEEEEDSAEELTEKEPKSGARKRGTATVTKE